MSFTMQEAINIIVSFYLPLGGFWKEEEIELSEIRRFIAAGYASLDKEYGEKYCINSEGKEVMHPYIMKISEDFISFMKGKCFECSNGEVVEWFKNYYQLNSNETAEEICTYIRKNLVTYGHRVLECYSARRGQFLRLEELVTAEE